MKKYPHEVAAEGVARRPDLSGDDAIASCLSSRPGLSAQQVIDALDEAGEEHRLNLAHDEESRKLSALAVTL
jgi:hypothetical protein